MDSYIILTENKNMMKIKIEYINITIVTSSNRILNNTILLNKLITNNRI